VYHVDAKIAGETVYNGGQQYTLFKEFTLPATCQPTAAGSVTWRIYAGVDARGNDPDSGWHEFTVNN